MNTLVSDIVCEWAGRHEDSVKVIGASSLAEARDAALKFSQSELPIGIVLDEGFFKKWPYDEPQPTDWQDYYWFNTVDEHPVDQREWWEK